MATRKRKSTSLTTRYLPVMPALDVDAVSSAVLNGAKVDAKLANAVTGGEIELAMDQATQLTLPFEDPEYAIWLSDLFADLVELDLGEAGRWRYDRKGDIGAVGLTGTATTLTLWAAGEAALRAASGPLRKSSAKLDLAGIVALVAREAAVREVVSLRTIVPKSGEAPPANVTIETTATRSGGVTGGFSAADARRLYGQDGNGVKFKLSDRQVRNLDAALERAKAKKANRRATKALLLAIFIESQARNDSSVYHRDLDSVGILQIRDSTARGMNINNASIAESCDAFLTRGFWGKGGAIALSAKNAGATAGWVAQQTQGSQFPERYDRASGAADLAMSLWFDGAPATTTSSKKTTKKPGEWRRGANESSWTMLDRYARLFGCRRFVALPLSRQPRLVVARDQDLIRAAPHLTLDGLTDEIFTQRPQLTLEGNAHLKTMEFRALAAGWSAPPGAVVRLENAGAQTPETWLVQRVRVPLGNSPDVGVVLQQPTTKVEAPPATSTAAKSKASSSSARSSSSSSSATDRITTTGGARGIVEQAARLAASAGGSGVYVGSDYRAGSTTSSGNASDHASNNAQQAARDIGVRGIDLLVGPPSPKLDLGVAAIGKAFGRSYGNGRRTIIDTFQWRGYRVQIIWRTPQYGGHMGHIHIGARRS